MDETTPTSDSFPVGLKRSQIRKLSEHDFALYLFIAFEFLSSVIFCSSFWFLFDFVILLVCFFSTIARIIFGGIGELSDL